MKQDIIFPYLPDSGNNDQDFAFWSDDADFSHIFKPEAEAIASIDKLLRNRTHSVRELIDKTGHSRELITRAVAKMVDKGRAAIDSFKTVSGKYEAQLAIKFDQEDKP